MNMFAKMMRLGYEVNSDNNIHSYDRKYFKDINLLSNIDFALWKHCEMVKTPSSSKTTK